MRIVICLLAAPFLSFALATSAVAERSGDAAQLYAAGAYVQAAARAEAEATPASLVFAARALTVACLAAPHAPDVDALLRRAEASASEALARDPSSVEARLQLAFTLGARARRMPLAQAMAGNYAPRGRALIEEALAAAPQSAQAHALLGGWHLEVLRRGGRAGAVLYGARLSAGLAAFDRARALAPDDGMIPLQYAIALLLLDSQRFHAQVSALLTEAMQPPPRDAFEAHAQAEARRIAEALADGGPQAAESEARRSFF